MAQETPTDNTVPTGRFTIGTGMGFHAGTADGAVFGLFLDGEYHLDQHLSIGPLLQLGVSSDLFLTGLSGQIKYTMKTPALPGVIPYLEGGVGFMVIDADRPGRDDDVGFLVPFGGGFDVELGKNVLLGTAVLLNYTSADVSGQPPIFMSWLFGLRFRLSG
ncbi:MAG: hypothetical protein HY208_06355 [Nitrospirae bacterium]|nr:hypothetical protein [Nitrospirota bacterium]